MLGIRARKKRGNQTTPNKNRKAPRFSTVLAGALSATVAATLCIVAPAQAADVSENVLRVQHPGNSRTLTCGYTTATTLAWTSENNHPTTGWGPRALATKYQISFNKYVDHYGVTRNGITYHNRTVDLQESELVLAGKTSNAYSGTITAGLPVGTHTYQIKQSAKRARADHELSSNQWENLNRIIDADNWVQAVTGTITVNPTKTVSIPKPTVVLASDKLSYDLKFAGLEANTKMLIGMTPYTADTNGNITARIAPKKAEQLIGWELNKLPSDCTVTTGSTSGVVTVPGNSDLRDTVALTPNNPPQPIVGQQFSISGTVKKVSNYTGSPVRGEVVFLSTVDESEIAPPATVNANTGAYTTYLHADTPKTISFRTEFRSSNSDIQGASTGPQTIRIVRAPTQIHIETPSYNNAYGIIRPIRLRIVSETGLPVAGNLDVSIESGTANLNYPTKYTVGSSGQLIVAGSTLRTYGKYTFTFSTPDIRFDNPSPVTLQVGYDSRTPVTLAFDAAIEADYGTHLQVPYTVRSEGGLPDGQIAWHINNNQSVGVSTSKVTQSSGMLDLGMLQPGTHTIHAFFESAAESKWPNSEIATVTVKVKPASTQMSLERSTRATDDDSQVMVSVAASNVSQSPTGRLEVYRLNQLLATATLVEGQASFTSGNFTAAGSYTFRYVPDSSEFNGVEITESPVLTVFSPSIAIDASLFSHDLVFGDTVDVSMAVASTYSTAVSGDFYLAFSSGEHHNQAFTETEYSTYAPAGSHYVDVEFRSNKPLPPSSAPVRLYFQVQKFQPVLEVLTPVIDTNNQLNLKLSAPQNVLGPTGLYIITRPDGSTLNIPAGATADVTADTFTLPGTYSVTYTGDNNYLPSTGSVEFHVTKRPVALDVSDIATEFSGSRAIAIPVTGLEGTGLESSNEGQVTTTITDAENDTVARKTSSFRSFSADGFAHKFSDLAVGSYSVTTTFERTRGAVRLTSPPATITVSKAQTELAPQSGSFHEGWNTSNNVVIAVKTPSGYIPSGDMQLTAPHLSKPVAIALENGIAHIPAVAFTASGTYAVNYNGDSQLKASAQQSFEITRSSVSANVQWKSHNYGDTSVITINGLPTDATGTVTIELLAGGKPAVQYTEPVSNGSSIIPLSAFTLKSGAYTVRARYSGDARYASTSVTSIANYTVNPAATQMVTKWNAKAKSFTFTVGSKIPLFRPTGTVVWEVFDSKNLRAKSGTLAFGASTNSTSTPENALKDLAGGKYTLKARYVSANTNFLATTSTYRFTLEKASAPKAIKSASASGTARVGKTLSAKPGTWNIAGVSFKYQWLRDGKAIKGATKSKYTLTQSDVSKRISVRVTAVKNGHVDGTTTSAHTAKVGKTTPAVTATLSKSSIRKTASTKVTVRVKAQGISKPTGKVTVKVGKKTFVRTLKASHKGKITVTVKKLNRGVRQKVTAKFSPTGSSKKVLKSKTSTVKRLTVK